MLGSKNETTTTLFRPWESLRTAATDVRLMCEQRWARRGANCVLPEKFTILSRSETPHLFFTRNRRYFPLFFWKEKSRENRGWKDKALWNLSQTNPGFYTLLKREAFSWLKRTSTAKNLCSLPHPRLPLIILFLLFLWSFLFLTRKDLLCVIRHHLYLGNKSQKIFETRILDDHQCIWNRNVHRWEHYLFISN